MRTEPRPVPPETQAARERADLEKRFRGKDPVDAADTVVAELDDANRSFGHLIEDAEKIRATYRKGVADLRHDFLGAQARLRNTLEVWHRLEAAAGGPEPLRQAYVRRYGGLPGETGMGSQLVRTPKGGYWRESYAEVPPQYLRSQYGFIQQEQARRAEGYASTLLEREAANKKARRPAARKKVADATAKAQVQERAAEQAVRTLPEIPPGQRTLF
jgi:hypothetical protein